MCNITFLYVFFVYKQLFCNVFLKVDHRTSWRIQDACWHWVNRFGCQQVASVLFLTKVAPNEGTISHTAPCYCAISQCQTTLCVCLSVCAQQTKKKLVLTLCKCCITKPLFSPSLLSACSHLSSSWLLKHFWFQHHTRTRTRTRTHLI